MSTLTPEQIKEQRDRCQAIIDRLDSQKHRYLDSGQITVDEFNEVTTCQHNIQHDVSNLNSLLITRLLKSIRADTSSPGTLLASSIDRLNHAIDRLNYMHEFLDAVAMVIKVLGDVARIISTFPI